MSDQGATRRGVLAASAAGLLSLQGCSALDSGTQGVTFSGDDGSTPADAAESGSTPARTSAPTETASESSHGDGPTETAGPATEPETVVSPPDDALSLGDVRLSIREGEADVEVDVVNGGNLVFTRVELRVDLYYTPLGGEREHLGFQYAERIFEGEFSPGETATLGTDTFQDGLRGRVDADTPREQLDLDVVFRRVCTTGDRECFVPGSAE